MNYNTPRPDRISIFIILTLFLLLIASGGQMSVEAATDNERLKVSNASKDIFLVIGQSNTAGRGDIEAQDEAELDNADLFNGTEWEPATNPMNAYSTIRKDLDKQQLAFAYTFGKSVGDEVGATIGIVMNARGGTNINAWEKGADDGYYEAAIAQVNEALAVTPDGVVKGILWHQGESNRNDSAYMTKLAEFVSDLRTDLGDDTIPFIAGQLSVERDDNETFNTNLEELPDLVAYTDFVSSADLTTTDFTHFDSESQRVLGERYASKILSMVYGIDFEPSEMGEESDEEEGDEEEKEEEGNDFLTRELPVLHDTYVRGGDSVDLNYGDETLVRVKETDATDVERLTRRGYLAFDLSEFNGGTVVSANLIVSGEVQSGSGTMEVSFYEVETSWDESTLTFSSSPEWSDEITTHTFSGSGTYAVDVTSFVEANINEPFVSFALKSNTIDGEQLKLSSKEENLETLTTYLRVVLIDAGVIEGVIWSDLNEDGVFDENEPELVGITIEIADVDGTLVGDTLSGDNGRFAFTDLSAGTYSLSSNDMTLTVTIEDGEEISSMDFGVTSAPTAISLEQGDIGNVATNIFVMLGLGLLGVVMLICAASFMVKRRGS